MTIEEMKQRVAEFEAAQEILEAFETVMRRFRGGTDEAVHAMLCHVLGPTPAARVPAAVRGRIGTELWNSLLRLKEDAERRVKELREQKHG